MIKNIFLFIQLVSWIGLVVPWLPAQAAVLSASSDISGTGGSVSWSVGQVGFIVITGTTGSLTEGVQQPYEIQSWPGIDEANENAFKCLLYPNPATNRLWLETGDKTNRYIYYQLFTSSGKLVQNARIEEDILPIPMETLASGTYLLTVTEHNTILRRFNIIKK